MNLEPICISTKITDSVSGVRSNNTIQLYVNGLIKDFSIKVKRLRSTCILYFGHSTETIETKVKEDTKIPEECCVNNLLTLNKTKTE